VGKSLPGQFQAQAFRCLAVAQRRQHFPVPLRVDDDQHVPVVLGGGANHGRTADVDVLNGLFQCDARFGYRLAEGVEVHRDQVDRGNPVLFQLAQVILVAQGQDAAMDTGMQGLHPPVQNLRKTGHVRNVCNGYTGLT